MVHQSASEQSPLLSFMLVYEPFWHFNLPDTQQEFRDWFNLQWWIRLVGKECLKFPDLGNTGQAFWKHKGDVDLYLFSWLRLSVPWVSPEKTERNSTYVMGYSGLLHGHCCVYSALLTPNHSRTKWCMLSLQLFLAPFYVCEPVHACVGVECMHV